MTDSIPASTYRLQLGKDFSFYSVGRLVDYFHKLGISHLYLSPFLQTRRGSSHGYAVSDFDSINSELGTLGELKSLSQSLHKNDIGLIIDFVPNHMSIFDNPWWTNVLENGQSSPYASFFDIDWHPIKEELSNRVLLPILEDFYGNVLDRCLIKIVFNQGSFQIKYHEHLLPVDPSTYVTLLAAVQESCSKKAGMEDQALVELQSIITACRNLPHRTETKQEKSAERQREKEVIKKRLRNLHDRSSHLRKMMQAVLSMINGTGDGIPSHEMLHQLLENQAYRLSYWLVAADEINYRRFFDINELAALNMEHKEVFDASHKLLFELIGTGIAGGLRIDHVDGLYNPSEYFTLLHAGCSNARENYAAGQKTNGNESIRWLQQLIKPKSMPGKSTYAGEHAPLYVVVEKILVGKETLRPNWDVSGTTGYEFARDLNGIFINRKNSTAMLGVYSLFTGRQASFPDIIYWSKYTVLQTSLSAELNLLAHHLNRLSEKSRHNRDFTLNNIREALQTVIACFPTYRTYIDAASGKIDENDRAIITAAINAARKRNVSINALVYDFISNSLLLKYPDDMDEEGKEAQRSLVMRFQQLTGPVMAKGLEDTAFYIFVPLLSLNDVGGNPIKFSSSVEEFHAQNLQRNASFSDSMITTSTHDSKRSEDVRARINVISELPRDWQAALKKWQALNAGKKTLVEGEYAPDANEEYYLYQILAGSYPIKISSGQAASNYTQRVKAHMTKALREAKIHSSWSNPRTLYEDACNHFIDAMLDHSAGNLFLDDFLEFNRIVTVCGMYNSLSQVLLKIFSPGVPDIYRGNEVWIYDLTDPDNRRKINFSRRRQMLEKLQKHLMNPGREYSLCEEMAANMEDGRIKLYVTWRSLDFRRQNKDLFHSRTYVPLSADGKKKNHVCAFLRRNDGREVIAVAPVLAAGLTSKAGNPPVGESVWDNTLLNLPGACKGRLYRNIFTGEQLTAIEKDGSATMELARILNIFPVAALTSAGD